MTQPRKPLKDLKREVTSSGYSVVEWASKAGMSWQTLYRKISRPDTLLVDEYDRLEAAARDMRKTGGKAGA